MKNLNIKYEFVKNNDEECIIQEMPINNDFKHLYEQITIQKDKAKLRALISALDESWLLWLKKNIEAKLKECENNGLQRHKKGRFLMIPRYKLEKLLGLSYPTLAMFLDMGDFEYGKNQGIICNKHNKDLFIKLITRRLSSFQRKPKQAERYKKALEIVKLLNWEQT